MKPLDVKSTTNIDFGTKIMIKTVNFKLMTMLEYGNIQNVFAKGYTPNWSEPVSMIRKILCRGHMLLVILTVKKLLNLRKRIAKDKSNRVLSWKNNQEKRW